MYDTLFALLRAALHGGDIPEVPNFSELLGEARKQTVDGLLYALPEISVRDIERPRAIAMDCRNAAIGTGES